MKRLTLLAAALLALAAAGCNAQEAASSGCASDSECDNGFYCATETGTCRCRTDDVCGDGMYCNPYGVCQPRPPCLGNADCAEDQICDSNDASGGRCIAASTCGSSVHCDLNTYCHPQQKECVAGCRSSGDCQLGYICVGGTCQSGTSGSDCTICPASPDPDPAYCQYGEVCTKQGSCQLHSDGPDLCSTCDVQASNYCPDGMICLIDPEQEGQSYCTVTCNTSRDCPNGLRDCGGLSLVFEECTDTGTCSGGAPCGPKGETNRRFCGCLNDDDCSVAAAYKKETGFDICFTGSCVNDPNWLSPKTCSTNDDCLCIGGTCAGTADMPCSTAADCALTCIEEQQGDVLIGKCRTQQKACGKEAGLDCSTILTGTAQCQTL